MPAVIARPESCQAAQSGRNGVAVESGTVEQKIAAALFIALGAFTANYARGLRMYTSDGPGAGLFPLIIGIGLVIVGALWLVQLLAERNSEQDAPPVSTAGRLRLGLQVAALLLFSFMMQPFGYIASAAVLVILTALIAGERSWLWIPVVAGLCSVGVQYLFRLLGTEL